MRAINSRSTAYFSQTDGIIGSYLTDIGKLEILPDKTIKRLLLLAKKGDEYAVDKIVKSYQRFVFYMCKRLSHGDNTLLSDLISEANIGLITAIKYHDGDYDNNFITFARYWMQKKIYDYLTFVDPMIKQSNKGKTLKLKKINNNFFLLNGRYPELDELKSFLVDDSVKIVSNLDLIDLDITPLSTNINDDYEVHIENEFIDKTATLNLYEDISDRDYEKTIIGNAIGSLTPKEQNIIKMMYGIDSYRALEINEIADKLGMTTSAIRLINVKILQKMKVTIEENKYFV